MNFYNTIPEGKGIYVFSDPAGANSIFAIIDCLQENNKVYGKDFLIFTNKIGIFNKKYNSIVERIEFDNATNINIQSDFSPDYLFSATSNNNFEHLWRKSLTGKAKIYSFIDHWTNYIERFSFDNEIIFGDEVWVVNEIAKTEAIKAGIPFKSLRVTGNPYYEKVKKFKPKVSKECFFKFNNLSLTKSIVLYISDYLSVSYAKNVDGLCELGYDEYTVFSDLLDCFNSYKNNLTSKFQFVIKIHPKAPMDKFNAILKKLNVKNLDIITLRDCDSLTVNYYSDYVIGMHSNMVIESFFLNKKLLRVQTGQIGSDILNFSQLTNKVVVSKSELKTKLHLFLSK